MSSLSVDMLPFEQIKKKTLQRATIEPQFKNLLYFNTGLQFMTFVYFIFRMGHEKVARVRRLD